MEWRERERKELRRNTIHKVREKKKRRGRRLSRRREWDQAEERGRGGIRGEVRRKTI